MRLRLKRRAVWLLVVLLCAGKALGQEVPMPWRVFVDSVARHFPDQKRALDTGFYLVKWNHIHAGRSGPVQTEVVRALDTTYAIVSRLPDASFFERWWTVNDLWKFSSNLLAARKASGIYQVRCNDIPFLAGVVKAHPSLRIVQRYKHIVYLEGRLDVIRQAVLPLRQVTYIGYEPVDPEPEASVPDLNLNPNRINMVRHFYPELKGEKMTLSVKEQRYNIDDIDLLGRNVQSGLEAAEVSSHATEMATIAAGSGNSFVKGKGVAPRSFITSSDFASVLPDADADYERLNSRVQNHSYGTDIAYFYGAQAEAYDRSAFDNPALLHVFSSGNAGQETSESGSYAGIDGYANLTGNFKMAKNVLVIGAMDTVHRHLLFSSSGPAYDGRIKPELVAYGAVGSSNAAALTSGLSILLQQYYLEKYHEYPESALLKAVLINSADEAGAKGIDHRTGFGSINGYRALQTLENGAFVSGEVVPGETLDYQLGVPEDAMNLKVTLVWNDPPAASNTYKALVHDLDLEVSLGDTHWKPWVLNTEPDSLALSMPAFRGEDHLNNVEQVSIAAPVSGSYSIRIYGYNIAGKSQRFSLAYQWDRKNTFLWECPTGSDNMPYDGESGSYFRWKSTLESLTGRLEYSIDGGNTWALLDQVDLGTGYYRWKPGWKPGLDATKAIGRMVTDDGIFYTETFTVSSPPGIRVGFNCADSLMIHWSPETGASSYEVYGLGETDLELLRTTADTLVIFQKSALKSDFLALQPVLDGDKKSIRSYTYNVTNQGVACYLSSFYQELKEAEGIYLNLNLGTGYGVKSITFERLGRDFQPLGTIEASDRISRYRFLDDRPDQGLNVHRARILFENGEILYTDMQQVYYLTTQPVLIFPNPLFGSKTLNIYTRDFGTVSVYFYLLDRGGRLIRSRRLVSERGYVDLSGVRTGFYFYRVEAGKDVYQGKLIIR